MPRISDCVSRCPDLEPIGLSSSPFLVHAGFSCLLCFKGRGVLPVRHLHLVCFGLTSMSRRHPPYLIDPHSGRPVNRCGTAIGSWDPLGTLRPQWLDRLVITPADLIDHTSLDLQPRPLSARRPVRVAFPPQESPASAFLYCCYRMRVLTSYLEAHWKAQGRYFIYALGEVDMQPSVSGSR